MCWGVEGKRDSLWNLYLPKTAIERRRIDVAFDEIRHESISLGSKNEPIYKEALKSGVLTEDEILHLMVEHPKLIERPIVERNGKAIVARPIERLALFLANNWTDF